MSAYDILRSFTEARVDNPHEIIRDGITYGTAREAVAEIARLRAALEKVEWVELSYRQLYECPFCLIRCEFIGQHQHRPDCEWVAAMKR